MMLNTEDVVADVAGDVVGGPVLWRQLLAEATQRLAAAGVPSAVSEARRLVASAAGCDDVAWAAVLSEPATQRGVASFDAMLARRVAGEPLQYVLGAWGFRSLDLFVDPRVLIPRPETEVVAGHALAELQRRADRSDSTLLAADLGCGSGAIGLSLAAERVDVEVFCTDVSAEALAVASANLAGLGRPARRVRLARGSWYEALPPELRGRFDVIASNPPYIAADNDSLPSEVADYEPPVALYSGRTGLEASEAILQQAPDWLASGGAVVLELADGTAWRVAELARAAGLRHAAVHPDLAGRERVLVARRP